jgi:uncharacterized protein
MPATESPKCRLAVVKIASRCNLNCSYCYMYNMGDETYREQPKFMSDAVLEALVRRCADHCALHGIGQFTFALHGGEPLLAGTARVARLIALARRSFDAIGVQLKFVVQTNGVLLDDAWCACLGSEDVRVGVSIDGPPAVHDRQRVTHRGKGSYAAAVAGFRCAQRHGLRPGLLIVIDVGSEPEACYAHLKTLQPDRVDFLLPEGSHALPPKGLGLLSTGTPYADWLLAIFELWWREEVPAFGVRLFEQIVGATLGMPIHSDALGSQENEVLVIETNGDIGPVDVLRAALPGVSRTGMNVLDHSLDDGLRQQTVALYHGSNGAICAQCQRCPISQICGGGYLSHRYATGSGFDNPSVYCRDLTLLITTLRERALSILPARLRQQSQTWPLSFADAIQLQRALPDHSCTR